MTASASFFNPSTAHPLHAAFLALLPKLQTHATIYFRDVRCPDTKADKLAECQALAWKWYVRLHEQGKDINQFLMAFIFLVARAVKSGRRACGTERAEDVMSPVAQRRHSFTLEALPSSTRRSFEALYGLVNGQQDIDAYEERLRDNTVTPPPDAAAFRIDWAHFLSKRSERDRRLAHFLSLGHRAKVAAKKFKLSQGRVTQLRQQWCKESSTWAGEEDPPGEKEAGCRKEAMATS